MRVLVTGTSGRVGAAVARELSIAHRVTGVDLRPGPMTTVIGDLSARRFAARCSTGVDAIVHCAALHAPHVGVHSEREFFASNVEATEHLLECAERDGVRRFVLTSTTSLYGNAMIDADRAVWVTEALDPVPRDVYDRTKLTAESRCRAAADRGLPCISLRMSRSFYEPLDRVAVYRLYRGVDLRDVAAAHRLAVEHRGTAYESVNISARSPFRQEDLRTLMSDAPSVIERHYPGAAEGFARRGWTLPKKIDRVYVTDRATEVLGYRPRYNFDSLFNAGEL